MKRDVDKLAEIFQMSLRRMEEGRAIAGNFNPGTDKRRHKMPLEALQEILDSNNYIGMEILTYIERHLWRCDTCTFWDRANSSLGGVCSNVQTRTQLYMTRVTPLTTREDFSCIHYEEKS